MEEQILEAVKMFEENARDYEIVGFFKKLGYEEEEAEELMIQAFPVIAFVYFAF